MHPVAACCSAPPPPGTPVILTRAAPRRCAGVRTRNRLQLPTELFAGPPADPHLYAITGCLAEDDTTLTCDHTGVPTGAGMGFEFTVVIGGAASASVLLPDVKIFVLSSPFVIGVPNDLGSTAGGTTVTLIGTQFVVTVTTPPIAGTARYGPYTASD